MSVVIVDDLIDNEDVEGSRLAGIQKTLEGHEGYALVELDLKVILELHLELRRDPLEGCDEHALIVGDKARGFVSRKMAKSCEWVVTPEEAAVFHSGPMGPLPPAEAAAEPPAEGGAV